MPRIALAQINAVLGDLAGNSQRLLVAAERAVAAGAEVLLAPELALCGYPPEDLLLRPDFYRASAATLQALAAQLATSAPHLAVVVGHPHLADGRRYNAASVLRGGRIVGTYCKQLLPNYEVFDEVRYFAAGEHAFVFEQGGHRYGLAICEDIWQAGPAHSARQAGAQTLLVLNASPYHLNKGSERLELLRQRASETGLNIAYTNLVGGQDELVFDGGSLLINAGGDLLARLPQFAEAQATVDLDAAPAEAHLGAELSVEAQVYQALVLGVRDYLGKNGFPGALIGLSGGVDSALTLAVAVDALGADKVRAVMMPSPYTADISLADSREMVQTLGVRYDEIAIAPTMQAYAQTLQPLLADLPPGATDTTEENVQARIRGNLLMALSNRSGALVLTTGNKSEMAVGYCTLYGDMAGGFAVIKDIAKTLVYRVCHYRNSLGRVIPERILTRAPSAELRPNQTDQDSLPPYDVLDAIVELYMEQDITPREIVARGYAEADVRRVVRLLRINEYKRRQAPVGIRVTQRSFGKDWRYPITNRYADEW